jgi:hypothetical protein
LLAFAKSNGDLIKLLKEGDESGEVLKCGGLFEEELEDSFSS